MIQQYVYLKQAWGDKVELPFLLFLNKIMRLFIFRSNAFVFKKVLKDLENGKQPNLIVLSNNFDGRQHRGARVTKLKLENLNTGYYRYCFCCGVLVKYEDLVRYLNYYNWRPLCFNHKLIKHYKKDFCRYKLRDIKPMHIVFVPRGYVWP